MKFVRHYVMQARPDTAEQLLACLVALRQAVLQCPGSQGTDLLRSMDHPDQFFFIEHWDSKDHHAAALQSIPPELMSPLQSLLAISPTGTNLLALT